MITLLKYGREMRRMTAIMSCCKVLLSVFLCFGVLFCCGQAKLLYPVNEGNNWKGNNSYNFKYLKGKISSLCPVKNTDANSKYIRSFARVPMSEGRAVIASGNYVKKTCLSVSYDKEWVDWPNEATKTATTNNIDPQYPYIVYAYSTGDQYSGYDVRYWVDDGDDSNDATLVDDKIKPKLVGRTYQLFQIGTDVLKLQSIDLSGWDFSEVTSMQQFFKGCTSLTSINLGTADLRNVTNISEMFNNCNSLSWESLNDIVNSLAIDKSKLTTRDKAAAKEVNGTATSRFEGNTVTTANGVQYVISSTGKFDNPIGGSTDMTIRNTDAVQVRQRIDFNFDVLYESNGDVARYVIQYLDGDKDWEADAGEITDILTVDKTAELSDLKSYIPTYTPASPETFGGNKQFRVKVIKNNGYSAYSEPFMLVYDESMVAYPQNYTIKKSVNGGPFVEYNIPVDNNGDVTLRMNSDENAEYVIPEGMEIQCKNFYVYPSSGDYSNSKFVNKGTVVAAENIILTSSKGEGISYDCNGLYIANNITFRGKIADFKGIFNIENRFATESNGQGQDITIGSCATIRAYEGNFQHSGGAMKLYIDGEMTVERLIEGNMIHVRDGGMLIVGETDFDPSLKIVSYSGSILTLCYNPTRRGVDNLGYCAGRVYFNDNAEEHGWDTDPQSEGDINEGTIPDDRHSSDYWTASGIVGKNPIQPERIFGAFHSYDECIDPVNTKTLGIDDDPFLPQDKEIKPLYNKNCCSDEYSGNKIQIRELGNKWFRLINGELIYCENDNEE